MVDHDLTSPRPLSWEESWTGWANPTTTKQPPMLSSQLTGLSVRDSEILRANIRDRYSYAPITPQVLMVQQLARITKILIYKDVVNLYVGDQEGENFKELWEDLHSMGVKAYDLKTRLQRAEEGKEAANRKYKNKNWFGAMYTYALAWGCMIPYFPEGLAPEDPLRKQYESLECALFGNLAAVSITGADDDKVDIETRKGVLQLGLRCVAVILAKEDVITVGTMIKNCRRASDLSGKLEKLDPKNETTSKEELGWYQRQEQALNGVNVNVLFRNVEATKKVSRMLGKA